MKKKSLDANDFDECARNCGNWFYDNGWAHKEEYFGSSYVGSGNESPESLNYLRMLRHDDSGRTLVLHLKQQSVFEIWSGTIQTEEELAAMNQFIFEYWKRA